MRYLVVSAQLIFLKKVVLIILNRNNVINTTEIIHVEQTIRSYQIL